MTSAHESGQQPATSDTPRDLTSAEEKWIARLKRTLDAMPKTLCGFHSPGSISFADYDDIGTLLGDNGTMGRQAVVIETISSRSLDRIDAGDW